MRITQLALLGLSLIACRGGGGGGGDDDTTPDGPPVGGSVTIQEIQNDAMPKGTAVTVDDVVVTAIDTFGARTGDIWVEEPGGGEFSGVKVFGAPLDQVAALQVGDIVTISNAEKDEFAISADTSGRTVTEIKGAGGGMLSIVKTSAGAVPTPSTVDAAAIDALPAAAQDAEWEKWEGVLVNVINARQTGAVGPFGAGAEDQQKFDASGNLAVESSLAGLGTNAAGTCYASITGIGDYAFDYLLLPRATADLVAGGTGCTAQQVTTVADVQAGTVTGDVVLNNVFVTARSLTITGMAPNQTIVDGKTIWVSDSLQGASGNGIAVFFGNNTPADASLAVGAKINISGKVSEFDVNPAAGDTLTELTLPAGMLVTAPAGAPAPLVVTAAQVNDIATGEPLEGVLVQIAHAKVTAVGTNNKITLTDNAGTMITMDDDIFFGYAGTTTPALPAVGTCFAPLTGVMSVQLTDNIRTINPRAAADMVVGTGCN